MEHIDPHNPSQTYYGYWKSNTDLNLPEPVISDVKY